MAVYFCKEFIRDLADHDDAHFAARVLSKVVTDQGGFADDADDHPYRGVPDAWIRYVSRQNSAYRAIFIRKDGHIYWYRAGGKPVEVRLRAPRNLDGALQIGGADFNADALQEYAYPSYIKTKEKRLLKEVLASRQLLPHKTVTIVSPAISADLFSPVGLVGKLISSVLEGGGAVSVITRPPKKNNISEFRWLVDRGVDLMVHERVNARFIHFDVDKERLDKELKHISSTCLIGSAEYTSEGIGVASEGVHDELVYEVHESDLDGSDDFIMKLVENSLGFDDHIRKIVG
ncbi:hypothetical protein [Pinirhizobacter soli]|uniref:hypothetical protein n=1 Tax=Pinirhizobacter soli TaxID=2786953 RepID=UPI002029CBA5|nr:hypothetical protein [Pinirhizobacter soli]